MSRISSGTMVVGIFAILVGLGGAYLVRQHLQTPPAPPAAEATRPPRPTRIPMAARELEPGREVTLGDILIVPMTAEQLKKAKLPFDTMSNSQQIIGRIIRTKVEKGKAFTPGDLYPEGTGPSVAERLKPGYRAVTVPITNVGSVARFASPGSVVDVLFRTEATQEIPETTVLLVDRVEVLALDATAYPKALTADRATNEAAMVTLAVTPRQASALKVAEGRGEFTLAMRSLDDDLTQAELEEGLTLNELLRISPPVTQQMEIVLGGASKTVVFGGRQKSQVLPSVTNPVATDTTRPVEPSPPVIPAASVSGR